MRTVIQRVSRASVSIGGTIKASIGSGLLVLIGIEEHDSQEDIEWLSGKISRLRIFRDKNHAMNLSPLDAGADILVISQFTLHASTKKGNRPSFIRSAGQELAITLYEAFIKQLEMDFKKKVQSGQFGAYMQVELVNDGPVTILMDSKNRE